VERVGGAEARRLADEAARRARERVTALRGDTSTLLELVESLAVRTT